MKELKKKHSVWLSESAWANVEHHYQADNCSTKNEYIEKAIQFYSGYLDTEHAEEYLPRIPVSYTHLTLPTILRV